MKSKQLWPYLFVLFSYLNLFFPVNAEDPPTTATILASYGYSTESHTVTTDDGYILEMFRLYSNSKCVAFFMHDIMCSSDDFVAGDFYSGLFYKYIENGCDLWLGNARGSKYSMQHTIFDAATDNRYWNFSWHEIGVYDLPKMTDYVVNVTGVQKLYYFGVGQGTTVAFVMTSMLPAYKKHFVQIFAMAPVIFLNNVSSQYIKDISHAFVLNETLKEQYLSSKFTPDEDLLNGFGRLKCKETTNNSAICDNSYFLITSYDPSYSYSDSDVTEILSHNPSMCSANQLLHYAQLVSSGRFAQFDYGPEINMIKYESTTPPDYNLNDQSYKSIYVFIYDYNDFTFSQKDLQVFIENGDRVMTVLAGNCKDFIRLYFYSYTKINNCVVL